MGSSAILPKEPCLFPILSVLVAASGQSCDQTQWGRGCPRGSLLFASPFPSCCSSQEAQFQVDNEEDGHQVTMTWGLEFDLSQVGSVLTPSLASGWTGETLVLFSGSSRAISVALSISTLSLQDHDGGKSWWVTVPWFSDLWVPKGHSCPLSHVILTVSREE